MEFLLQTPIFFTKQGKTASLPALRFFHMQLFGY